MQQSELARRLASVHFFTGLSETKLREVAGKIVEMKHSPGRVLTEQGASSAGFHLILSGTARVDLGGRPVKTLHEGDSFGEISLIDGEARSATVIAGDEGLVTGALSALAFAPLLNDPEVANGLLRVVTARLRAAEARSADS